MDPILRESLEHVLGLVERKIGELITARDAVQTLLQLDRQEIFAGKETALSAAEPPPPLPEVQTPEVPPSKAPLPDSRVLQLRDCATEILPMFEGGATFTARAIHQLLAARGFKIKYQALYYQLTHGELARKLKVTKQDDKPGWPMVFSLTDPTADPPKAVSNSGGVAHRTPHGATQRTILRVFKTGQRITVVEIGKRFKSLNGIGLSESDLTLILTQMVDAKLLESGPVTTDKKETALFYWLPGQDFGD